MTISEVIGRYIEWHEGVPPKDGKAYNVALSGGTPHVAQVAWEQGERMFEYLADIPFYIPEKHILCWTPMLEETVPTRFLK